ncbi:uncharacterized protein LOC134791774 [Cydia splendana]|uniref:uncharacterized protein LOC134791774 n=1 Tax=Cydia splendana TaxID=1100963 RepID=UPI00300D14F7
MLRSLSEPSLGTIGTTNTEITVRSSRVNIHHDQSKLDKLGLRGQRFFEGRLYRVTMAVILLPWLMWWQVLVQVTNIYQYIILLLTEYYLNNTEFPIYLLDTTICDLIFAADVFVYMLHACWTLARLHIRVYRRSSILLLYDVVSLIPLRLIFQNSVNYRYLATMSCWFCIGRIYRLLTFFMQVNEYMHNSRRLILLSQHFVLIVLFLHGVTCVWYYIHKVTFDASKHYNLGYPPQVGADQLRFNNYMACFYYCACRLLNVIFGDSFPVFPLEMWLTSAMMIMGHCIVRYRFIGKLTWDLVVVNSRRLLFVDQFHHMLDYLQKSGAPKTLVELAYTYKMQLWRMKDGVLTSDHLQKLPLPLQMELIYDINIAHFHDTLIFRDSPEAFLRQISLLMRHEIFMAGQHIWNQGVVKNGMICLKKGVVEMLSDEDNESPMIAFTEGTVLGELSLFYSIPAKVTVTAATYVELQVLRRTDFMRAMSEQPALLYEIRDKIEQRLRSARTKQEAIEAYEENDSRQIRTRYRPMKVLKNRLAGIEDEDPTFVDDSHMYYRDAKNVRRPKFTEEFLELYQMSPKVTSIKAPRICLRASFPWILEPDTDFMRMLHVIHFIMILYLCIMVPYSNIIQPSQSDAEKVLNTVITTGLVLHIYIQLTTAIYDKNVIRNTVKDISEVKMATISFYLDILSVFPFYIFTDTLDPQGSSVANQVAALCPVLQMWHIWEYMDKLERNFKSNVRVICVLKFALMFCIFCYWSGCFLYLISCPNQLCRPNSWVKHLIFWETKVFSTLNAKHEKPMVSSLMFGAAAFTGAGIADIAPGVADLFVLIAIFVLGFYVSCFYTGTMCSHFMLAARRRCKFKESMRELFCFLSVNQVSEKIKARVRKFFCVQWYYNNAVCVKDLFEDMSANIQQEVLSIETVETLLYCPLFQDCSRDLLQTVAANSRTIVLPDDEVVQHAADIGRDMYIVQKGHCNIVNNQGKVVTCVGPGSQFGMIEMLFGLPKVYTVLTSTNCILLHMEYSALVQCWGTFPDISAPIMKVLEDPEIRSEVVQYEVAQPMVGRIDVKTNRIAQEIKESFVAISGREERAHYTKTFEKLGVMRFLRFIILPGSITPYGMFLKVWCIVRSLLAVYYVITVPYCIAVSYSKFRTHEVYYVDMLLYVDMAIMAYVAYYDERSLLITHPLNTISRYLKHGFVLDAIICFPLSRFVSLINDQADLDKYRLNKLLQLTRIVAAVNYWEEDIMQTNQLIFLLKFLPAALTIVNFASAFSFISFCRPYLPNGTDYIMANCSRVIVMHGSNHNIGGAIKEYVKVFFHSFKTFVGCGCTPTMSVNTTDALISTTLVILTILYFAFMCGYVASARSSTGNALLDHIEKTSDLANFLYQENVDPMLTARTLKYFDYLWRRTNGSNPQQICRRLNSALMEDTLVFMYERTLREVPLFSKVERSFIRVITQHLNEMYFLKAETVIQCKDVQPYIYIIYRGKVDVMNSYNEMITCMGPGGMFGNFTGHPISCSEVSIYASRSLDLLVIPSQTFFNLVKYYPKIQEPLNKAFETSKDYILPINVNIADDSDSEGSELDDIYSMDSKFSSICTTDDSRYDLPEYSAASTLRTAHSQSNLSQTKSVGTMSAFSLQSQKNVYNLFRPGTWMYLMGGYLTSFMATANYVMVLYSITTLNDCYGIMWALAFFDIYFYLNMYLTMHEGYASKRGELIMDASKCRRNYYRHTILFYSDLFVNFPLMLFGFCFPYRKTIKAMHYLRANKLFRIKYLFEFYNKSSVVLTNNLTTLQAVMTVHAVVFFVHTFTCLWLFVIIAVQPICTVRTIKTHFLEEETPTKVWDYTTSFYVMATLLTATGGDEYLVNDLTPEIIQNICLLSGKVLAAVVVATSMQVTFSKEHTLTKYEKATGELMDVLKNQGLSDYQSQKLWKYVKQLWVTERGRQLPALLAQTPYVRRCDLMSAMFGQHLRNCYVFADTGESFLRQLTVAMDYTIFFPGNYIVVAGDSDARMHWVSSGTVSVVSVRPDLTETTHELLGPGDVFGILQGLHRGIIHCFSYRAETKVSILTLSLDSWIHILPYFPEAQNSITNRSNILFARITN